MQPFNFPPELELPVVVTEPALVVVVAAALVVVVVVGLAWAPLDGWHWEYHSLTKIQLNPLSQDLDPKMIIKTHLN